MFVLVNSISEHHYRSCILNTTLMEGHTAQGVLLMLGGCVRACRYTFQSCPVPHHELYSITFPFSGSSIISFGGWSPTLVKEAPVRTIAVCCACATTHLFWPVKWNHRYCHMAWWPPGAFVFLQRSSLRKESSFAEKYFCTSDPQISVWILSFFFFLTGHQENIWCLRETVC